MYYNGYMSAKRFFAQLGRGVLWVLVIVFSLVLLLALLGLLFIYLKLPYLQGFATHFTGSALGSLPSAEYLLANYSEHRAEFEELKNKVQYDCENGLQLVNQYTTIYSGFKVVRLNEQELEERRAKLDKLGIKLGYMTWNCQTISFEVENKGAVFNDGLITGYYYSPRALKGYCEDDWDLRDYFQNKFDLFDPVDDLGNWSCDKRYFRVVQKIDENWYIFFGTNTVGSKPEGLDSIITDFD